MKKFEDLIAQMEHGLRRKVSASLSALRRRASALRESDRSQQAALEAQIAEVWGDALELLELLVIEARRIGTEFPQKHVRKASKKKPHTFASLVSLHSRAALTASECLTLLRTGHAAGAYGRWRTLHELSAVSELIATSDEDLAERYQLHFNIQALKAAREAIAAKDARFPLSAAQVQMLEGAKDALEQRFGREFGRDHGWAAKRLKHSDPRIKHILAEVGFERVAPLYRESSYAIHGQAVPGVLGHAVKVGNRWQLLNAPSTEGLFQPGVGTAIAVALVTVHLLKLAEGPREKIETLTIHTLAHGAVNAFEAVQKVRVDHQERARAAP